MRWMVLLVPLVVFGVNEGAKSEYFKVLQEKRDPYTFDKKARLELQKAKIEAQMKKDLAKIEYEKTIDAKKIEKERTLIEANTSVEKEKIKTLPQKLAVEAKEKVAFYTFLFGLVALVVIYFLFKRYEAYKKEIELRRLEAQKEAHEKEMMMKEKELQAQVATKLIDAIANGKLTKEQEEKLLKIVSNEKPLLKK